ncbi:amino acid ABC transporter permease protein (plasmid) [Rhizobium gallicum]|uniref:Amino acid ABC transporter permease protein n=1 Tax=Rhizobium gallicum TaxID=56730 RepID=A0A1L5NPK7_9HYPH|nr:ABC transporter permease subunit [Rhizobium gallicum]APO69812.1 amino acid ABC transporter permease protein [Rhizobium gallicum]
MTATLPYLGYIVQGLTVTIGVTLAIFASAMVVGAFVALGSASEKLALVFFARTYITVFRALPELLCVFIVYYGADIALQASAARFGTPYPDISPFAAVTVALGIQFGAYCAEIFGDARRAIPKGLHEAGDALGLGPFKVVRRITLPLVLVNATPALGNLFLVILKVSALASVIGLEELTRRAKIVAGTTREPFAPYAIAAICFLIVTAAAGFLQHYLERRSQFGRRAVKP